MIFVSYLTDFNKNTTNKKKENQNKRNPPKNP
jgi:hypothetical protein